MKTIIYILLTGISLIIMLAVCIVMKIRSIKALKQRDKAMASPLDLDKDIINDYYYSTNQLNRPEAKG